MTVMHEEINSNGMWWIIVYTFTLVAAESVEGKKVVYASEQTELSNHKLYTHTHTYIFTHIYQYIILTNNSICILILCKLTHS